MSNNISTGSSLRTRLGFTLFSLSLITFGVVMGGNIYQLIAEVPNWSADMPTTLITFRNAFHVTHAGYFFQTFVPFTILLLIAATILLWNRPKQANRWTLAILGCVVVAEAFTGIYFLPRNFILFLDPIDNVSAEDIIRTGKEWKNANYFRVIIVITTMILFLKTYRILCEH